MTLQRKLNNSAASNLHFPFNTSFSGNNWVRNKMEMHWVSNKCSWVLQRKRGLTSFSEWMKMTYAVGLHESKLSHQGYPVQQYSVWFRNCSLPDSGQDRGWLCPLGLEGRLLQWQTSPAASLLQDWNANAFRCRRHSNTRVHTRTHKLLYGWNRGYRLGKA